MNEAQTEHIIIDPLLQLLGYSPYQIYKQGHDGVAKNFPDYTLLPNTPHKWFLEAKKLDLHLQDGEAAQAVNYANNQGAEWAVLTNGHIWYIYNAHLPKPLTEKRVMQIADLFLDADAIDKLLLLSRQSMQNKGLTEAWTHERITAIVKAQLQTPNSAIRKSLKKIAGEETGATVSDVAIEKAIASCGTSGTMPTVVSPIFFTQHKATGNGTMAAPPPPLAPDSAATLYTFQAIAKDASLATHRKPQVLVFSDGHKEDVKSWAGAAKAVVERVGQAYGLPDLPFKAGQKGNK